MTLERISTKKILLSSLSGLAIAASLALTAPAHSSELQEAAGPVDVLPAAARLLVADTDGDGRVSRGESDAFSASYFAVLDADGDGIVSRAEYVGADLHGVWWRWLNGVTRDVHDSFLSDGFVRHDLDGDGNVDAVEFVARTGTDHAIADENGDGRVSVLEFHMLGLAI